MIWYCKLGEFTSPANLGIFLNGYYTHFEICVTCFFGYATKNWTVPVDLPGWFWNKMIKTWKWRILDSGNFSRPPAIIMRCYITDVQEQCCCSLPSSVGNFVSLSFGCNMFIYACCLLPLTCSSAISIDGTYQLYGITRQGDCKQKIVAYTLDMGDDFDSWCRWGGKKIYRYLFRVICLGGIFDFCPCTSCATAEEHVAVGKQTRCQKYGFLLLITGAVYASKNVQVELSLGMGYCIYVRLSRDGCDLCSAWLKSSAEGSSHSALRHLLSGTQSCGLEW